ncbi:FtsX-like permease family protein [Streptomyces sp. NPDC049906]|uniref:FtsX-like permease family protein n=1 Tax=Streptomyces sp. NPDC049906 TaxID=3155656 RepID=UPI00342E51D0
MTAHGRLPEGTGPEDPDDSAHHRPPARDPRAAPVPHHDGHPTHRDPGNAPEPTTSDLPAERRAANRRTVNERTVHDPAADPTGPGSPTAADGPPAGAVGRRPLPAPWVRTRLRTARGAALALALLAAVTAALAAGFPLALDSLRDDGLRHALAAASPAQAALRFTAPQHSLSASAAEREAALRGAALRRGYDAVVDALPAPLTADRARSSYGVRTADPPEVSERWLPRPRGLSPRFVLAAQHGLDAHARVRTGRLPRVQDAVTLGTPAVEAAVTVETAARLNIATGSVLRVPGVARSPLTVRITGIVTPRDPRGPYWSTQQVLRTPSLVRVPSREPDPPVYWLGALLLHPDAAPALLGTAGTPERYWQIAPGSDGMTGADLGSAQSALASAVNGTALLEVRRAVDANTVADTELDDVLTRYGALRDGVMPLVTVAVAGTAAVALVVLLMAGGLAAGRRRAELTVLRARGASLPGLTGRLLAETAVVAVPAGATGLTVALLALPGGRWWPAALAAAAVTLVACLALPLRALVDHRSVRIGTDRDDLTAARPSRRRAVAELTLLVLAVGAVATLRGRGAEDGGALVALAPVLIGVIAALLLVRLYPLPLRLLTAPARRLRGLLGHLALARAARGASSTALPLLALLTALTTAAFGGSVLAGVADTRDRAALLATGADARVDSRYPLPRHLPQRVRQAPGVETMTAVAVDYDAQVIGADPTDGAGQDDPLRSLEAAEAAGGGDTDTRMPLAVVNARPYADLSRRVGVGAFPARALARGPAAHDDGRAVPVLASPATAARLGRGPVTVRVDDRRLTVRIAVVRPVTPAMSTEHFLVVDADALGRPLRPNALFLTGRNLDPAALRTAGGPDAVVHLREAERARYTDSPLQLGAERVYTAAVAAGAGFAALALLLALARTAPERAALLARLRTMGLPRRDGRRLLVLESLPPALLAAAGGIAAGWAAVRLLAPGTDLTAVALAAHGGRLPAGIPGLRPDPLSLVVPALAVVALTVGVAAGQAWWTGRREAVRELRLGDDR